MKEQQQRLLDSSDRINGLVRLQLEKPMKFRETREAFKREQVIFAERVRRKV